MNSNSQQRRGVRWLVSVLVATSAIGLAVSDAYARPRSDVIVLPEASSAEGIARGRGSTFFAGDLMQGDIFKGDLRRGTAELFIDVPAGRQAVGMDFDRSSGLLYVAGFAGVAYVDDMRQLDTWSPPTSSASQWGRS